MASRKQSLELSSEAKLISYLESGANISNDEASCNEIGTRFEKFNGLNDDRVCFQMMRRKHSMESSYSAPKDRLHGNKQGKSYVV